MLNRTVINAYLVELLCSEHITIGVENQTLWLTKK